ncbi:uncharacterized protein DUF397 [Herbihabitans rhizosphaerae]|uniref:Uncharacterized protein DUF397 n=1 Tax=Herbihabitans rhizosphaerae TaxID=1872711 RepID=A0A4Q7KNB1_9PSEU|nr:DUF397 domain-containing protein [Herbihabitans rhizosphaerae]RZS37450.1 uncharacterized protein DUF397 [Herbihabitans rhizosphaerae]
MSTVDYSRLAWRKSSRSSEGSGVNCVEVALADPAIAVRDSKNPNAGALVLPHGGWASFLRGVDA